MKKYFYSNGNEKQGPCTFEELKALGISKSTLIWYEGLENWTPAEKIDECKYLFQITPPPMSVTKPENNSNVIKKWIYSTLTALILLVICVIICEIAFGKLSPLLNFINAGISYTSGKLVYDHLTEKEKLI